MSELTARLVDRSVTAELRRAVLRPWLPAGSELPGDDIGNAVHIGSFVDGRTDPVGACLVYAEPCTFAPGLPGADGAWRLRSMATAPEVRGQGAGTAVLDEVAAVVRSRGASLVWCHAREVAEGFYQRHGWVSVGELFDELDMPHRNMYLQV